MDNNNQPTQPTQGQPQAGPTNTPSAQPPKKSSFPVGARVVMIIGFALFVLSAVLENPTATGVKFLAFVFIIIGLLIFALSGRKKRG